MSNRGWFEVLGLILILSIGFCLGVEHQAKQKFFDRRNYTPMYSSRIVVKNGESQVIAFTTPTCDSLRSNDDGYWFNTTVQKPESFIVVEPVEWPFKDECSN